MKQFELEISITCLVIFLVVIALLFLIDKYTYFLKESRNGWSRNQYAVFAFIVANLFFFVLTTQDRDELARIKKEHIHPVKATAKKERKSPYGIRIYLQDDVHSSYQFDLDNPELSNEFIEKVNSGYLVSKFRNSTDLLLTNGSDSVYYNLYY